MKFEQGAVVRTTRINNQDLFPGPMILPSGSEVTLTRTFGDGSRLGWGTLNADVSGSDRMKKGTEVLVSLSNLEPVQS